MTGSYRACAGLTMRSWKVSATTGPSLWHKSWSALILIFQPECIARSACGSSMPGRASTTTQRSTTLIMPRNAMLRPDSRPNGRRWLPTCARDTFARKDSWPGSKISLPAHPSMSNRPFWNVQRHAGQENREADENGPASWNTGTRALTSLWRL